MTISRKEFEKQPIEDRLLYAVRVVSERLISDNSKDASLRFITNRINDLMEEAAEDIKHLRQEIDELNDRLYDAGERLMGEDI